MLLFQEAIFSLRWCPNRSLHSRSIYTGAIAPISPRHDARSSLRSVFVSETHRTRRPLTKESIPLIPSKKKRSLGECCSGDQNLAINYVPLDFWFDLTVRKRREASSTSTLDRQITRDFRGRPLEAAKGKLFEHCRFRDSKASPTSAIVFSTPFVIYFFEPGSSVLLQYLH